MEKWIKDILIEEKILKKKTLRITDLLVVSKADQKEDTKEIMAEKVNLIIMKNAIPIIEDKKTKLVLNKQCLAKILKTSYPNHNQIHQTLQVLNLLEMPITLKEIPRNHTQN